MKVKFDHVALRCADTEKVKSFFTDIIGLSIGYRPPFSFPGFWLYTDRKCVLHLFDSGADFHGNKMMNGQFNSSDCNNVDHIAFWSDDYENILTKLQQHNIKYSETTIPDSNIRQVFIQAPENLLVEMDFQI